MSYHIKEVILYRFGLRYVAAELLTDKITDNETDYELACTIWRFLPHFYGGFPDIHLHW